MPEIREITVYQFDELSDRAKERARDWYREASVNDDWWDSVYEDFTTIAWLLGVEIDTRAVNLMNGKTRQEPAIYFDLYCRSVEYKGTWSWPVDPVTAIAGYASQDEELKRIAEEIVVARARFVMRYGLDGANLIAGRIDDAKCEIDTGDLHDLLNGDDPDEEVEVPDKLVDPLAEAITDLGHWLLKQLDAEYAYVYSAEYIDENIRINEYEFDEDGELA